MPLHFRRSVSAGPFRFNFSKGGVGVSVGVKGLRLGTGPRGHYIHASYGGISYRKTITNTQTESTHMDASHSINKNEVVYFDNNEVKMTEIESASVHLLQDESFSGLLAEIKEKNDQIRMSTALACAGGMISSISFFVFGPAMMPAFLLVLMGWLIGKWIDSFRRATVLFYDLDENLKKNYIRLAEKFDDMIGCARIWHVQAGGAIRDLKSWKQNAGASHVVQKKETTLDYKLPEVIKCNLIPPAFHVGKQILYFFPDVMLIEEAGEIGAVGYNDLNLTSQDSNFIEEIKVPKDAQIIGYTWKHPNRNGGPDRRFKNNYEIPICKYEALHIASRSGVNELMEFSRPGVCRPFVQAISRLPGQSVRENLPLPGLLR